MRKNNQRSYFVYFTRTLFVVLLIGASVQAATLNAIVSPIGPVESSFIYLLNFVITTFFFRLLIYAKDKNVEMLGYYFMALSLVKLIAFSFILHHTMAPEQTPLHVFVIYFIPYSMALFVEILFLIKNLNKD